MITPAWSGLTYFKHDTTTSVAAHYFSTVCSDLFMHAHGAKRAVQPHQMCVDAPGSADSYEQRRVGGCTCKSRRVSPTFRPIGALLMVACWMMPSGSMMNRPRSATPSSFSTWYFFTISCFKSETKGYFRSPAPPPHCLPAAVSEAQHTAQGMKWAQMKTARFVYTAQLLHPPQCMGPSRAHRCISAHREHGTGGAATSP